MRTHRRTDTASAEKVVNTFSDAVKTIPLLGEGRNDTEHRRTLVLVEYLVDHDDLENLLFELLCTRVSKYGKHAPESKTLSQHLEKILSGVLVLRTLMDQYSLRATDLTSELDLKSNASNILNDRRALTVSHIRTLAERFNLPADAFAE